MKTIFLLDLKYYCGRWAFIGFAFLIFSLAIFGGANARFSIDENIYQNGPYQIAFIVAFLSLTSIFFCTFAASQLLFREVDAEFESLFYSLPLRKSNFILGRFLALFTIGFLSLMLLIVGFFIGQYMGGNLLQTTTFHLLYYIQPIFTFGFINTLFVSAVLGFVAWIFRNKLLVFVTGLLLYILYMVILVYSGSPLMAQNMPQSELSHFIAAYTDPFGISAFFHQTSHWSIDQRNTNLIEWEGIFLINRIWVALFSICMVCAANFCFSFSKGKKFRKSDNEGILKSNNWTANSYAKVSTESGFNAKAKALFSFVKIDLIYIFKSVPFLITSMLLIFAVGMEMYGNIEKGIRIPQYYASTGIMVSTILQSFFVLCLMVILFYAFDIFWRSKSSNFDLIENSTSNSPIWFLSKLFSVSVIVIFFSVLMILEGVIFQLAYNYIFIDWSLYLSVFVYASCPLILSALLVLMLQKWIHNKYLGIAIAALFLFVFSSSIGKRIVTHPLLKFLHTLDFDYSDMNGFGCYSQAFLYRLLFGIGIMGLLIIFTIFSKKQLFKWRSMFAISGLITISVFGAINFTSGYVSKSKSAIIESQIEYELMYRKYQHLPTLTITNVSTQVDLYPQNNSYRIKGTYVLENKTSSDIASILINFPEEFTIQNAIFIFKRDTIEIDHLSHFIALKESIVSCDHAKFEFELTYEWKAVNGHASFNAIVENGSFMRISRYYPQFGYLSEKESQDEAIRNQYHLGLATPEKAFESPRDSINDFINLDMIISTSSGQLAIGVGELQDEWKTEERNYCRYKTTSPIPFRFALSSGKYKIRTEKYRGKIFEVYFHPSHFENVEHLIKNAKLTMDYCEDNFGPYPFTTVRFVEISSFTKGFAATAYPATIFMTEDMIFHANIKGDKQQDVLNELAGHELSHMWWGNSQISPDSRAGASMLTETLAMYTEISLFRNMYGRDKLVERIEMYKQMYNDEKGFSVEEPIYKVKQSSSHISYYKGAIIMFELSELLGEKTLNLALSNFLKRFKYPHAKPISIDLIEEICKVSDPKHRDKIRHVFMDI